MNRLQTRGPVRWSLRIAAAVLCAAISTVTSGQPVALPATPTRADACSDFDGHVNGAWHAATELPAERAFVGSFTTLRVANFGLLDRALNDLLADPAGQDTPGLRLLAAHHASGLDEAAIERRGLQALQPLLARIAKLERPQLPALLAELARLRIAAPLALSVAPDTKQITRHALYLNQGGLGLPDRDDYLRSDETTQRHAAAYRRYAQTLLLAASAPADAESLDALMAFERTLAEASFTRVARRDPNANYQAQSAEGLRTLAPGLDWAALLQAYAGRSEGLPLVLGQPPFVQALARLAQEAPVSQWQSYLRVRLLDEWAERLPRQLAQAHFEYRSRALRGLQLPLPRAEHLMVMLGGPNGGEPLAQTLGELYVRHAFSARAQVRADAMVADMRAAMRQRILALTWMSAATRARALEKLEAMVAQIGAPASWRDWSGLTLLRDDFAGNQLRIAAWATERDLDDLVKPVDRLRWRTSPHIVNAFAANGNRIVFPAGILQPPFFDPNADDASNYGAIGMVIGHEITHHFDDRGRQFDAQGNLRDWWSSDDAAAYRARTDRVVTYYGQFEPAPGVRINGRQMLGENISDLGGIQIAYDALQLALERERRAGRPPQTIDGRTPEQRFFIANAVVWRHKWRMEALVQSLRTGQHSPPRFRILGPMSHMPAFARAFGCPAGAPMVAADPILIW